MNNLIRVRLLRIIGIAEGVSFLTLLLVAMPLKYFFGYSMATKVVGWAHGLLFVLYILIVLVAIKAMRWKILDILVAFAASLLPFGTFVLDKSWKKREHELKVN